VTAAADEEIVRVALNEDALFVVPKNDGYWWPNSVLGGYEPEIEHLLRRAADRPYDLLDAGANYGYWSILASSAPFGRHRVAAIEASENNFKCLVANARANGDRFHALHYAVLDVSGETVRLYGKKHWGLSLRKDWHPADVEHYEEVQTITLDGVAGRLFPSRAYPPFIKLDVEGAEVEAIQGAGRLIGEGALIAYEDHGKEPSHRISRFVLSRDDLMIWYVDANNRTTQITNIDQVEAIKRDPILGYNFFACRRLSPWASLFDG
jgi:FkbM family methyltransferase